MADLDIDAEIARLGDLAADRYDLAVEAVEQAQARLDALGDDRLSEARKPIARIRLRDAEARLTRWAQRLVALDGKQILDVGDDGWGPEISPLRRSFPDRFIKELPGPEPVAND